MMMIVIMILIMSLELNKIIGSKGQELSDYKLKRPRIMSSKAINLHNVPYNLLYFYDE